MPAHFNERGHLSLAEGGVYEKQLGERAGGGYRGSGSRCLKTIPSLVWGSPLHILFRTEGTLRHLCVAHHHWVLWKGTPQRQEGEGSVQLTNVFRLKSGLLGLIRADEPKLAHPRDLASLGGSDVAGL